MIIKNALVFTDRYIFEKKEVYIDNGVFVESAELVSDKTEVNAAGLMMIPGLVDVHTHGSFGYEFCDADENGMYITGKYLKEHGVTSYCPTSMTLSENELTKIFKTADREYPSECARIVGVNMEGPFICSAKRGAQEEKHIKRADMEFFNKMNSASGNKIKLVTVAPEEEGAMEFIKEASQITNVSLGHSTAGYEIIVKALENGANHITHLYNAMTSFSHRDSAFIGAAYDCKNCYAELICDGYHIHPSVIRMTFEMLGDKVVLISDSMKATGLGDGEYNLGGQKVFVKNSKATLEDGVLAGSATNLFDCMKKAISVGVSVETAIKAATAIPAISIGVFDKVGSITPGKLADGVIVDNNFNIVRVI